MTTGSTPIPSFWQALYREVSGPKRAHRGLEQMKEANDEGQFRHVTYIRDIAGRR